MEFGCVPEQSPESFDNTRTILLGGGKAAAAVVPPRITPMDQTRNIIIKYLLRI